MRRRGTTSRLRIALVAALAFAIVAAVWVSINKYRAPAPAPPEALAHIAEKNRNAAIDAAAHMRVQSATTTHAAEHRADQLDDAIQANAAGTADGGNSSAAARQD